MKPAMCGAGAEKNRKELPEAAIFPGHRPKLDVYGCEHPTERKDAGLNFNCGLQAQRRTGTNYCRIRHVNRKCLKGPGREIVLGNGLTLTVVQQKDRDLWGTMALLTTVTCNSKAKDMSASG